MSGSSFPVGKVMPCVMSCSRIKCFIFTVSPDRKSCRSKTVWVIVFPLSPLSYLVGRLNLQGSIPPVQLEWVKVKSLPLLANTNMLEVIPLKSWESSKLVQLSWLSLLSTGHLVSLSFDGKALPIFAMPSLSVFPRQMTFPEQSLSVT